MKNYIEDPRWLGQFRHLMSALGPLIGVIVAVLSIEGVTFLGVLAALAANWMAISGFVVALIPFYLSWKAKEKEEYKSARLANKVN